MDIVLLLGAGAEPAQCIARRLVGLGSRVYGLSNKFPEQGFAHRDFLQVPVNPADPAAVRAEVEKIVAREGAVGCVILAGHNPVEDAFESAHPNDVVLAVFAGLAAPLAAVRAAMPGLIRRRGSVIAITRPVFGPGAALAGVVEAGLASFCDGLFAETRDTGVRVSHIRLQENAGPADPAARYSNAPQSRVQPDIVADTVESMMRLRENNAITRLVLRPQATREEPRIPVTSEPRLASLQIVQLPTSRNYPPAEEKIFTPEYRRPDYAPPPDDRDFDADEDDDEAVDPELAYLIKPRHRDRFVRETSATHTEPEAREPEISEDEPVRKDEPVRREAPVETRIDGTRGPVREERRDTDRQPQHRQEPRQEQNRYHNPYAPQRPQQKGQRHGAIRIQAPSTSGEPATEGARAPAQQPQRPQPIPGQPLRFEQMPRPRDWQGPRYPQGGLKGNGPTPPAPPRERGPDLHPGYRKAQEEAQRAAAAREQGRLPAEAPAVAERAPDLHPKYREAQEQRAAQASRPQQERHAPDYRPRIITDATGRPVGGAAPVSTPAAQPVPVIVPVESGNDSGDKNTSGRSEAVTLDFAKKPATKQVHGPGGKPPAAKPVVEKIVKAERDEEIDEAPVRLKKRPAVKKTPAKADKALARVEAKIGDEPDDEAGEATEAKPAKPKRPATKKKA